MKKKVLASLSLAAAMIATTMPAMAAEHDFTAHANDVNTPAETCAEQTISTNTDAAQCDVYAKVGSTFTVTIPKKITLSGETKSGSYTVSCTGDIAGNEYVSVVPAETFAMKQNGKDDVTATITQETKNFRGNNYVTPLVAGEAKMEAGAAGSITAAGLTAGAWNGNFNFAIALNTDSASN